jgi:hypothetical protein
VIAVMPEGRELNDQVLPPSVEAMIAGIRPLEVCSLAVA